MKDEESLGSSYPSSLIPHLFNATDCPEIKSWPISWRLLLCLVYFS